MKLLAALLFASSLSAQITATSTQVNAQAGAAFSCIFTPSAAICTVGGKDYPAFLPALTNGGNSGSSAGSNGNTIGYSYSQINDVLHWAVSVQPSGGKIVRQSGVFGSPPPPPPAGPMILGTLVDQVCQAQGTGFHASWTGPLLPGQRGAVLLSNEPVGNCVPGA